MEGSWRKIPIWYEKDKKTDMQDRTLCVIFLSVTDNILRKIIGEVSTSVVWKKLEELYSVGR